MDIFEVKNALTFLSEINNSLEEDDFGFLSKSEKALITNISNIPKDKWTKGMIIKSLKILEFHKENLEDELLNIDFSILKEQTEKLNKKQKITFKDDNFFLVENNEATHIPYKKMMNLSYLMKLKKNNVDFDKLSKFIINMAFNMNNIETGDFLSDYYVSKTIMNYQKLGSGFCIFNDKVFLADDKGLGKSLQSLVSVDYMNYYPCLIVCPNTLKYNWEKEINELLYNKNICVPENINDISDNDDFIIINYESIHNYIQYFNTNKIKSILFDESHFLKNPKAKRTKASLEIGNDIDFIIAISGSPTFSKPKELITQLELIEKLNYFGGYWDYVSFYCNNEDISLMDDLNYSNNLEILSKKLRESCLIRREKTDVLSELPPKQRTPMPVNLSNMEEYIKFYNDYKNTPTNLKSERAKKLHKLKMIIAKGKLEHAQYFIDDFLFNNNKIIIFVKYNESAKLLMDLYPESYFINKDQNQKERFAVSQKFQMDKKPCPIIVNIGVGYAGLDLFSSSNILFFEFDSVHEINEQCEDRAHRIGQIDFVNCLYLIGINTYDETVYEQSMDKKIDTDKIKYGYLD